jgi:hypothetical protein
LLLVELYNLPAWEIHNISFNSCWRTPAHAFVMRHAAISDKTTY